MRHPVDGLVAFQKQLKVKLTFDDLFNFDECMIDVNDFTQIGNFFMLDAWPNNVITEHEQSPHFTLVIGFCGKVLMKALLIRIGSEEQAPHPYHSELLETGRLYIAQSSSGWINQKLKTEFIRLNMEDPECAMGSRPTAGNADGQLTNTRNEELSRMCIDKQVRSH